MQDVIHTPADLVERVMTAAIKSETGPGISVKTIPVPVPNPGQALIRVATNGICGSDIHVYEWIEEYHQFGHLIPFVIGHEVVGHIEIADGNLPDDLTVGDRVAVAPATSCGTCEFCRNGQTQRCERRDRLGWELPGGFSDYVVAPVANLYRLSDNVDERSASLTEPLAVAVHALRTIGVTPGGRALVLGAGAIGLLAVQVLRAWGVDDVVLAGTEADRIGGGLGIAERLGASSVLSSELPESSLNSFDLVYVAAGARPALEVAVAAVRRGGSIVVSGLGIGGVGLDFDRLVRREIRLSGAYGSSSTDWVEAVRLLDSGAVKDSGIVSHTFGVGEAERAFQALVGREARKVTIVPGSGTTEVKGN
ncbi:zinc-binding dehydrogenase [Microbacterium sp. NFH-22A-Y]|uniref:zinc-dependent alcohol dehydrogenase n=1 Tax=Microbacterium sp. NFH-22A-Y TaxID=2744448 RepID=UPI001F2A6B50|nr:alcohol dehydrogenase catalytic domain-containing protein [Microbacterium sp. NFH-22A-Y]